MSVVDINPCMAIMAHSETAPDCCGCFTWVFDMEKWLFIGTCNECLVVIEFGNVSEVGRLTRERDEAFKLAKEIADAADGARICEKFLECCPEEHAKLCAAQLKFDRVAFQHRP